MWPLLRERESSFLHLLNSHSELESKRRLHALRLLTGDNSQFDLMADKLSGFGSAHNRATYLILKMGRTEFTNWQAGIQDFELWAPCFCLCVLSAWQYYLIGASNCIKCINFWRIWGRLHFFGTGLADSSWIPFGGQWVPWWDRPKETHHQGARLIAIRDKWAPWAAMEGGRPRL